MPCNIRGRCAVLIRATGAHTVDSQRPGNSLSPPSPPSFRAAVFSPPELRFEVVPAKEKISQLGVSNQRLEDSPSPPLPPSFLESSEPLFLV